MSPLVRMMYASRATEEFNALEISAILEAAHKNNIDLNITGLLFVSNEYFCQCLEGPRDSVNELYLKIIQDQRHQRCELLELVEISDRYFRDWSMKLIPVKAIEQKILQKTGLKSFNPFLLDSKGIDTLLTAFRKELIEPDAASEEAPIRPRPSLFRRWFKE